MFNDGFWDFVLGSEDSNFDDFGTGGTGSMASDRMGKRVSERRRGEEDKNMEDVPSHYGMLGGGTMREKKTLYIFDSSFRNGLDFSVAKHYELIRDFNSEKIDRKSLLNNLSEIPVVSSLPTPSFSLPSLQACWKLVSSVLKGRDPLTRIAYSRQFFEKQFENHINMIGRSSPDQVGPFDRYIQIHYQLDTKSGQEGSAPLINTVIWWIETFLYLRSGNVAKTEEFLKSKYSRSFLLSRFLSWKKGNHSVTEQGIASLKKEYGAGRPNPWRTAIFIILGLPQPEDDLSPVFLSVEDFLWFQLMNIENNPSPSTLDANLSVLARDLHSVSAANFQDPATYCLALLGSQQFAEGIRFLYQSHLDLEVPALHLGAILYLFQEKGEDSLMDSNVFFEFNIRLYSKIFSS